MGWIRVSDDFYDHPKFTDVTPLSIALWIVGMGYCNRNLTDGYVPTSVAQRLCDFDGLSYTVVEGELFAIGEDDCTPLAISDLLAVDLWHEDGHDCDECPQPGRKRYYVHDYLKYQPSAAEIQTQREAKSAAGKKGADSRWHGRSHSTSHNSSDGTTDGKTMPPTPTPTPTPLSSNDDKESAAASPRKRPAVAMPANWQPTDAHYGRSADGIDIDHEAAKFRLHAEANDRRLVNWNAAFSQWLMNARPARQERPAPRNNVQGWMQLTEEIAEQEHGGKVSLFPRQLGGAS